MKQYLNKYTFREIDGLWVAVDSACQTPPNLADLLNDLQIVIDDNTQFCRIIRYNDRLKNNNNLQSIHRIKS